MGDYSAAYAVWLPLAKAGDIAAQRNVAHMLRRGQGVAQNPERALWFYERAASAGLASAALNAGMMRIAPDTSYRDLEKGAEWLNLAAAGGSPEAMWELGRLIEDSSKSTPSDLEAAEALIRRAAELGHREAQHRVADSDNRTPAAAPANPSKSISPISAASPTLVTPEQGARFMQGVYLFDAGDFLAAAETWRPLADDGVVEAQYRLGRLYRFGLGVTPDVTLARKWLSAAAAQGHEKAAKTLEILPDP
ncbi:MAG: sel1 repeat family protein [Rhodobiaceae bacterium]|nr:sel1 repeat family protein [Rhodobiaceae bacterium]